MWGKKSAAKNTEVIPYKRDEEGKPKPLAFPEFVYGTKVSECYMSATLTGFRSRDVLKFFTDLKNAAKESCTHKVAIYRLDRTTCVEYIQPDPVVRTIDCADAEEKEKV